MDVEAVRAQVDGQRSHGVSHLAARPAVEDSSRIGAERDDVAQRLDLGELFIYHHVVSLTVAFYCCSQTTETCGPREIRKSLERRGGLT